MPWYIRQNIHETVDSTVKIQTCSKPTTVVCVMLRHFLVWKRRPSLLDPIRIRRPVNDQFRSQDPISTSKVPDMQATQPRSTQMSSENSPFSASTTRAASTCFVRACRLETTHQPATPMPTTNSSKRRHMRQRTMTGSCSYAWAKACLMTRWQGLAKRGAFTRKDWAGSADLQTAFLWDGTRRAWDSFRGARRATGARAWSACDP